MGMGVLILQNLGILLDRSSAVEHCRLNLRHIFAESSIFILDLVSQLTGMAHDKNRSLAGDRFDLLKGRKNKYRGLSKTGLCLTEDIGAENSLRDTNLLDCRK
jgi:hypothetical protein